MRNLQSVKGRAAEVCDEIRGGEVGLPWDPATDAFFETGEAA